MKKILSAILTSFILLSLILSPASAVTGQTSSTTSVLYPGVTSTHVTTPSGSFYGLQDMNIVEFDPHQEGLSVNVTTGYKNLAKLSTVSNTLNLWNAAHPEKVPIVAINGDWFTISGDTNLTLTPMINIPLGFNMHGGEIVTTQQTAVESAVCGFAPSFGVASDGTPLIGCIDTSATMQYMSNTLALDGINRLPADNAIIMYTDKGPLSSCCADDAYELYVDFDEDYTVRDGMKVIGTVTAVSAPGEARRSMQDNRLIITARGTRISEVSSIPVGSKLRFRVSISDRYGNTDKWKTVSDCVGGHHEFARGGVYLDLPDNTAYPSNIVGITAAGKVIFICNDGRQSGYSIGLKISKLDDIARELGIVSGILMDGGGSTTMVQLNSAGGYSLVNRPCNTNHAERAVSNAVILAYDSFITDDLTFDGTAYQKYIGTGNNVVSSLTSDGLSIITATAYDPFLNLVNFGLSADEYKYIVIDAKTNYTSPDPMLTGFYLAAGSTLYSTENCKVFATLPATGKSEKFILDLSSVPLWNGDIHSIRIDIFDNFTGNEQGLGLSIREMKFCKTLAEAQSMTVTPGDVNGDGQINSKDVTLIKRFISGVAAESDLILGAATSTETERRTLRTSRASSA
jgi:hypothetical protein